MMNELLTADYVAKVRELNCECETSVIFWRDYSMEDLLDLVKRCGVLLDDMASTLAVNLSGEEWKKYMKAREEYWDNLSKSDSTI